MMDKLVWFFFIRRLFFGENEIAVRVPSLLKLLVKEVSFKLLHNIFSYSTSIISSNSPCLHVFFRSWTLFTSSSSSALFSGALMIIIIMRRPSFSCPSFLSLPHCTPLKRWVTPETALLSVTRFQRSCVLVPFKICFSSPFSNTSCCTTWWQPTAWFVFPCAEGIKACFHLWSWHKANSCFALWLATETVCIQSLLSWSWPQILNRPCQRSSCPAMSSPFQRMGW